MWVLIFGFAFLLQSSEGSHFRGAIISWKPTTKHHEILITFRISWRRSYDSANIFCNDNTIRDQNLIGVSDEMTCLNLCQGNIGSVRFYCTDYSVQEDWTSGKRSFTYTSNFDNFEFGYTGQAWIDTLKEGGGNWVLRVTVDLKVRSDTGRVNSAPETNMQPILRLPQGCQYTITIPVYDYDGDIVRCRKASNRIKDECGGICNAFPAEFDEDACLIIFNATYAGWYGVAVQIEDFPKANPRQPLSSIPLQFLVYVSPSKEGCVARPEFLPPTRPKDSCIGVPTGTTLLEPIVAQSHAPGQNITEITTASIPGMTKSPVAKYPDSGSAWYVNISWTPTAVQSGQTSIFCFIARDTLSLTTDQRCIKLVGGEAGPTIINGTQSPTGIIFLDHRHFSVQFDQEFVRPKENHFIYIYNQNNKLVESVNTRSSRNVIYGDNNKLEFNTSSTFEDQMTYYILFQSGVVIGKTFCGIESPPIHDQTFWTFMAITPDTTPPVLTFTGNPSLSNGNITIQWHFNERSTARCWILGPTLIESAVCNGSWTGSSLREGQYKLYIEGRDLAGNIANPVLHVFDIDRTPPKVTITNRPHAVSNEQTAAFQMNCDESCYMECSVHEESHNHTDFTHCNYNSFIFSDSFYVKNLISNRRYIFEVRAQDHAGNIGESVKYTWQTDFIPPEINCNFISRNLSCTSNPNSLNLGSPSVKDNIASNETISLTYRDSSQATSRCMLHRQWTATDTAENSASCTQNVAFYSTGSLVLERSPDHAVVACGELTEMNEVFKQVFLVHSPCGLPTEISYTDDHPEKIDVCGATLNRTWTVTDNCGKPSVHTQLIRILGIQKPITPTSGERGIDLRYTLRWLSYEGSSSYQVYIWKVGRTRPNTSTGTTTNTYFTPPKPLDAGTKYFWQVEFILGSLNKTFFGPKWGFETRSFIDLTVKSIEVPPVAFSGQSFDVKWTIQNIGNLSTETSYGYWYDHVYLSFTNDFGKSRYVGHKMQWTILFPGDAYSSQMTVPLRQDDLGHTYIFVYTDKDNYMTEINKDNNLLESPRSVDVLLTPPPDLRVIGVKVPSISFSGEKISVHWTVINSGTGETLPSQSHWYDRIYLSTDQILDSSDDILATVANSRVMTPREQYSKSQLVQIPEYINGTFWILVETDSMNSVYEHLYEGNNVNASENSTYIMMQPVPDLSITEINMPEEVRTGNDLTIQWQVINAGADTTRGSWYDQVTITQMIGTLSLKLGYNLQYNSISPGVEYHGSLTSTIPPTLPSGAYLVTIDIDYENRIFEFNSKTNNRRAKKILVRQALPNLSVDIFRMNLITRDNINYVEVYAKIQNAGQGKTYPPLKWIDSIDAINSDSYYENNLARFYFSFLDGILPGSYYEINKTLEIPLELHGNFTFSITVDKFQNIEETNRADNRKAIGPKAILLLAPDLFLSAPSMEHIEIQAGQSLLVSYMVKNIGSPIKERTEWIDRVILSMSRTDVRNLIMFAEMIRTESSVQNGTYNGSITLNIPKNVVGEFYIHIVINNGQLLYEGERFENNKIALPIMIDSFPSPDLAVIVVFIEQSTNPKLKRILVVSWTVRNQGNSMTFQASWTDSILLSSELQTTTFDFTVTGALEISGEYHMKRTIVIPESFVGNYSINVKTNSLEEIDELGEIANNIGPHWGTVTFDEIPISILSSSIISVIPLNDTITTGRSVQIVYQVTNIGHARTMKQSWVDALFASKKESQSFQEIKELGTILQSMTHIGGLEQGQFYTHETVVVIPVDYNAIPFFCIAADFDTSMEDAYAGEHTPDMLGNISMSNSSQLILPPLQLPNLIPTITTLNNNSLRGGQPFTFMYQIQNIGKRQIESSWYDSIYLSDDFEMDPFDTKIITILRKGYIAVNDSTNFNTTVFIPFDLESKNYFLMIFVDSRNEIFEEDEKDNNLPISIFIEQSVSTDIAIKEVKAPSATVYGDSMTIEWTIINNGSRTAFGYKCDTVYFSKDNVLSIDDIQIADSMCNDISLAPYSNTSEATRYNVIERTPLAGAGSYKAIIRSRSNIFDSNQNNNILASNNSTCIDVKMLFLGIIENFNITSGKDMEYRITNISADQTLVINLHTADNESLLALYVKYGAPATKYDFDYRSDDSTVQNHTIIYPATKSGEFYLLIVYSGSSAKDINKSASISLFAKLASFEILDAFPHTAAPLGNITMGIKGTLIPEDVQAFLLSNTINISASFVYYFSSVSVYATFDITRVSIGESFSLHLCSKTHSVNATLSGALKTIQGTVGEFSIKISQPSQVLIGMTSTVTIDIENIGDTDIQSPLLLVNVEGEGLIKFITDVKETYYMKNYIIFSPPVNGPGGIFAPQAYTRLLFEAKQTDLKPMRIKIKVFLIQPNNESFSGILDHESLFKPSNYEESTWKTIWTNFRALVGETTSTISKKLCEVSNQFSLAGRRVHLFKDYLNFLLEVSDGALGDKVVVWASDIDQMSQENPKIQLVLERYVSCKIGIRALDGPLGKGWISPYWSTYIKTINISSAILYIENVAYEYIKTREGAYMNKLGPDLLEVKSGYVLTDTVHRRALHFDRTTLKLQSIISLINSSSLEMQYDDYLRLVRVRHSDGGYMDVVYDSKNRISVIQMKNDTVIGHKTILYSYHGTKNLLMSVTVNEETTYYDYDESMNLVAVHNADGSVFTATYSEEGFLVNKTYTLSDGTLQESTQFSYDHAAMVKVTTNPKKTNTFYTFDENVEVIAMKKDGSPTVKFIKTVSSKFIMSNDRLIQSTMYNKQKRTVRIEDANSDSITVMYGSSEDMGAFYDGGGNMYKFERNVDHSISRIMYPDGSDRKFIYNGSSLEVISQTGKHKKYIFNKDHQITSKDIGDGWPSNFEYDANGRMVKVVKGTSITFGYEQSSPSSITHEKGRVINFWHETNNLRMGKRASFKLKNTLPYSYDVEYKYDPRGNLIEVWDKIMITKLLAVDYDSRGRVSRKTLGNGAKTEYQYNQQTGFLEALFNYHVNGTLSSKFEYEYDTYQRRIKLHTLEGTYKCQYDPSGQLTMVETPLGVITEYSYDNRKNRIQVKNDGNESLYSVNVLNQYERLGDMTFEYDKNGNLIKKTGAKTRKLSYNEDNQLLSIETPTINCSLTYDALESLESLNCTDASGRSSQRHYLTDIFGPYGSDVLMQIYINGTDTKVTSYFHGADQLGLIAMRMDGDYFYFQFDPIGSVVMILNSSEVFNSYHYNTFGLVAKSHESLDNPFKFVGQWGVMQIPGIAELYFMRARFYDAEIGRFLSIDPLGIGGLSKNFYVYAYNNPVHLRDPSGKMIWLLLGQGALSVRNYVLMSELEGKDITWGGATKAFVDGVIDSAVSELKTANFIGKLGVSIGKGLYHTFTDVLQHKIDHTPYDWDHFWHDLKENELSEIRSTVEDSFLDLVPKPVKGFVKFWERVYEICQERSDNCRPVRETIIGWIKSHDPNDIISPAGYGAARFVAKDTVLEYTIRFENDENATASAQRVFIEHTFDEDLDLRSFRLGSYGFGNFTKELSFQSSIEQTAVNLTMELGIYIRIVAGVDLVKKQATWEFQALDMDTGLPPTNISKGFLPPNNGTSGQGFVHFSINVKADAPTLSRIDANATIYFDQNDPIDTPDVFNTIDDSAPNVTTTVIKDALSEGILVLSFNSTDVGAGVQEINLYSREVEGYILLKTGIKESLTSLNVNQGKNYTLLPLPVDYVGNRPQINDAAGYQLVFISIPLPVGTCSCSGHGNCSESGSICSCDAGFYGSFCNETVKPQYPPMLEVRVIDGYEDEPLQFYLSAKNISGPVDRLYLQVEGFPNETLFSKGNASQSSGGDEILHLEQDDFGSVNMSLPEGFSGRLSLEITAFAEEGNKTQQQRRNYTVYIEPEFTFDIKACLSENRTESVAEIRVEFNYTETNMSALLDIALMPPYLKLSKGQTVEFGRFQLTDADLSEVLYVQTDMKYSDIQSIEISMDFTVFDNLKSHWRVYHKARTIKCLCYSDCKMTTTRMPMNTTIQTVGGRITTLKVIFDYDIPTQDDLNDVSVYEKYLNEIKAVLMQLFKIKLGDHLQNINILYISRGSLIVELEIITDATMDTTSQLSASLLSLQSMQLLGRPSKLMSLTFLDNNVTVKGDSNLNECTFNKYFSPCPKNYECQVENGFPACREVVPEMKLFSLDDTTRTIVIASMGGLFGLMVLTFVIFMVSYICKQKKERKKLMHHPQHKGTSQIQETQGHIMNPGNTSSHYEYRNHKGTSQIQETQFNRHKGTSQIQETQGHIMNPGNTSSHYEYRNHKGTSQIQEAQFNRFRNGESLNHKEENMRMY